VEGGALELALVLPLAALGAYRFSLALVSYAVVDATNAPRRQGVDALVWPETPAHRSRGDMVMASQLVASLGRVTELRVIELGTKHGPPTDQIDVEVVVKLDTEPTRGMGFQLRNDQNRPVRQGMLDLLRDAFEIGCQTRIEYSIDAAAGKHNGMIVRVILIK
jgi:hypothetical protein